MATFLNEAEGNTPVMSKISHSVVLFAALLVLVSCVQNSPRTTERAPQYDPAHIEDDGAPEGFVNRNVPGGGIMYVREDVIGLGGYDSMGPVEISFEYADRQRGVSANEKSRIEQILADFRNRYEGGAIGEQLRSEVKGPCVLNSKMYVRELDLYRSPHGGSQVSYVKSLGSMIIVSEFSDSMTGEVLAVYSYKVGLGSGRINTKGADLVRLQNVIDRTLNEMTSRFGPLLPWAPMDSRAEFGCAGKLGESLPPEWRQS